MMEKVPKNAEQATNFKIKLTLKLEKKSNYVFAVQKNAAGGNLNRPDLDSFFLLHSFLISHVIPGRLITQLLFMLFEYNLFHFIDKIMRPPLALITL